MAVSGRFLPSRVYSRWKWIVRSGFVLVPFLMLLSGGIQLYLTPNKYRSTILFGLENGPPLEEITELVKSSGILARVSDRLELVHRFNVDKENAMAIVREATEARIVPDTKLIEMHVSLINKVDARDIAEQIPNSLRDYLVEISQKQTVDKVNQFNRLILEATDVAGEKSFVLAKMEKFHGANPAEATAMTALERARRASMLADAEVERLNNLRGVCLTENLDAKPRLNIHTAPAISEKAHSPDVGKELETLALRSLICGLLSSLLLPYLMELLFAPRLKNDDVASGTGLLQASGSEF